MKLRVTTIAILALALLPLASAVTGQEEPAEQQPITAGIEYDNGPEGLVMTVGTAIHITGGLYQLPRFSIGSPNDSAGTGTFASIEPEFVMFWKPHEKLWLGGVAGPGAEWISDGASDPLSIITGSVGAVAVWFPGQVGFYVGGKYTAAFDGDGPREEGFRLGAGLTFALPKPY